MLKPYHYMYIVIIVVASCAGIAQTVAAEPTYVKRADGKRAQPVVAIDNVCAWPNLTVLPDGTIVATIFSKPSHGLMAGDVECWASTDGGRKWAKRSTVARHENKDSLRMKVAVGVVNNGDLVVLCAGWSSIHADGKLGEPFRARVLPPWVCRSTDGGRTWSIDKKAMPATTPSGHPPIPFGDIFPSARGDLIAATYCTHGDETRCYIYRSHDDGKTWAEPAALDADASRHEAALFPLGKGKWIAAVRSSGLDLFGSDDDAKTWRHRAKITGDEQHPGHFLRLKDGRLLLTHGDRAEPKGVNVRFSEDDGKTWSGPLRIANFQGDGGYPASVQLPDGRVLTAYYAESTDYRDNYHMGTVTWDPNASVPTASDDE